MHYSEGVDVGYRWYDAKGIAPLFPFGFGLSYTTFAYVKAKAGSKQIAPGKSIQVSVEVTNTGKLAGDEVNVPKFGKVCKVVRTDFKKNTVVVGVGTGSTVNHVIDGLASMRSRLAGAVSSSEASTARLRAARIEVLDLNAVGSLKMAPGTDR